MHNDIKPNLEIEYKTLINEDQYKSLLKTFPFDQSFTQMNVYYDTSLNHFRAINVSCRIRSVKESHELTFKVPTKLGKLEYNFLVSSNDTSVFKRMDITQFMESLNIQGALIKQGQLITQRCTLQRSYGELCLDKNSYNGRVDYELEYEVDISKQTEGLLDYRTILNSLGLNYHKNAPSKIKRCLSTL
ncbi:MAG: CYTH domain-containing protein [Erysipelotrichaceae bacterium]